MVPATPIELFAGFIFGFWTGTAMCAKQPASINAGRIRCCGSGCVAVLLRGRIFAVRGVSDRGCTVACCRLCTCSAILGKMLGSFVCFYLARTILRDWVVSRRCCILLSLLIIIAKTTTTHHTSTNSLLTLLQTRTIVERSIFLQGGAAAAEADGFKMALAVRASWLPLGIKNYSLGVLKIEPLHAAAGLFDGWVCFCLRAAARSFDNQPQFDGWFV